MAKQLFERNGMKLFVGKVTKITEGAEGRVVNLEIEDIFDKKSSKVAYWNSDNNTESSSQRADKIKKLKIKEGSLVSYLCYEKDSNSYTGIDIKYINGVWNFRATPEEKERNVIFARLIPGNANDSLSTASFSEYDFKKRENAWSSILFFNYDENNLGEKAAKALTLAEGEKYKIAIVIANPATYEASKKDENGNYSYEPCDEKFTREEAEKQGYKVTKKYPAIKIAVLS